MSDPPPSRFAAAVRPVGAAALVLLLLLLALSLLPPTPTGHIVREGVENPEQMLNITNAVLESYGSLLSLITAAFGAIAFLITLQKERGVEISGRAGGLLFSGVVLLGGSLILCLVGREIILAMIARNSVDLELPALRYGRWACYLCLVAAALGIGFYAMEVALNPPLPSTPSGSKP